MANQAIAGTLNQDTKLKPTVVFEGCFDYSSVSFQLRHHQQQPQ